MKKRSVVDFTLGVHEVAWEVAEHLREFAVPDEFTTRTAAWYNGRERGLVFSVGRLMGTVLNIAVFEHRNSDKICALRWERVMFGINPPNMITDGRYAYPTDSKWDVAHKEGPDDAAKMAAWVRAEFERFCAEAV